MKVKLPNVRISFPSLFVAKQFNGEGVAKYQATFLFDQVSESYKVLVDAARAVAQVRWGDKAEVTLRGLIKYNRSIPVDGDTKAELDGYAGNFFCNASSVKRVTVKHRDNSPLTEQDGVIYGGCYVNAIVDIWAMDNKYGKRICATLLGVQFVRDGDSFSGAAKIEEDDFDDLGWEELDDLA